MKAYLKIIKLAWPIALGMLNNAIMQFTDRAFLANESLESLEAIMPASMLAFIFISFFQAVVAYSGIFVSQFHGAKDKKNIAISYHAGFVLAIVFGFLMLPLIPFGNWFLTVIGHSAEVLSREKIYYSIASAASITVFGHMSAQSYFTGLGRTRLVFAINIIGNLINIILDPLLIFGYSIFPKLGIAGAAIATAFATTVQWFVLMILIARENSRIANRESRVKIICRDYLKAVAIRAKEVLRFGIPSGAHTTLDLLSFTIFVFVTGGVGDLAFAISNACFSVSYLLFAPNQGFALAAATLVGQAQGRGDSKAAKEIGNKTAIVSTLCMVVLITILIAFHRPILSIFATDVATQSEFIRLGFILFILMGIWEVLDSADLVLSGALKGAGDTRFVCIWFFAIAFGVWMPTVFLVSKFHNTMPALWATVILEILILLIGTAIRWHRESWTKIHII